MWNKDGTGASLKWTVDVFGIETEVNFQVKLYGFIEMKSIQKHMVCDIIPTFIMYEWIKRARNQNESNGKMIDIYALVHTIG